MNETTPPVIIDVPGRFSRVCGQQVPDSRYADPIERPDPSAWSSPWVERLCFTLSAILLGWMFWTGMQLPVPW